MGKKQKKTIKKLIEIVSDLIKQQKKIWTLQQFEFMEKQNLTFSTKSIVAYVDGSCNEKLKICTYGIILIMSDGVKKYSGRIGGVPGNVYDSRTAEFGSVLAALSVIRSLGIKKLVLKYDCEAIAACLKGKYKSNDKIAQWFYDSYNRQREKIKIKLKKVKAHAKDKYNEEADNLARSTMQSIAGQMKKKKAAKKISPKNTTKVYSVGNANIEVNLKSEKNINYPVVISNYRLPMIID